MKNLRWLFFLLLAGVGCIGLFGLLLLYANYASNQAVPTFPRVTISTTIPEEMGVVNQPVIVFGEASDPDGIIGFARRDRAKTGCYSRWWQQCPP